MKTTKILLAYLMMFISYNSLFAGNLNNYTGRVLFAETDGDLLTIDKDIDNRNCTCKCDACRNCDHRSPDREVGYYDEYRPMSNRDFAEFKQLISDRTFESTKMDMTKSVIDLNYFSTEQIKEILTWFVFESNKLDLAKYSFRNTVDPQNYYKLYNSFTFESSVVDLDNYIKNYR